MSTPDLGDFVPLVVTRNELTLVVAALQYTALMAPAGKEFETIGAKMLMEEMRLLVGPGTAERLAEKGLDDAEEG